MRFIQAGQIIMSFNSRSPGGSPALFLSSALFFAKCPGVVFFVFLFSHVHVSLRIEQFSPSS